MIRHVFDWNSKKFYFVPKRCLVHLTSRLDFLNVKKRIFYVVLSIYFIEMLGLKVAMDKTEVLMFHGPVVVYPPAHLSWLTRFSYRFGSSTVSGSSVSTSNSLLQSWSTLPLHSGDFCQFGRTRVALCGAPVCVGASNQPEYPRHSRGIWRR